MAAQHTRRAGGGFMARTGFTLVELLVVIGIIALLISILLPSLNKARESAATLKCLSNLRQIGVAVQQYGNAQRGFLVPGAVKFPGDTEDRDNWATILVAGRYLPAPSQAGVSSSLMNTSEGESVFRCPSGIDQRVAVAGFNATSSYDQAGAGFFRLRSLPPNGIQPDLRVDTWYGISGWTVSDTATNIKNAFDRWPFTRVPDTNSANPQQLHKLSQFRYPGSLAMIYDGVNFHSQQLAPINARHNKRTRTNVLFADGHADTIVTKEIIDLVETRAPVAPNGTLKKYTTSGIRFILRPERGVE